METILSEEKLMKWLDISQWQLGNLIDKGLPVIRITRELKFFNKRLTTEWLIKHQTPF